MDFIANYWWLWLLLAVCALVLTIALYEKNEGWGFLYLIGVFLFWVMFAISVVLNIIIFAAEKFASGG